MNVLFMNDVQTFYEPAVNRYGQGLLSHYKQGEMCDVDFRVGTDVIRAHKIILCSASSFFRVMFESDFRESKENVIDLSTTFSNIAHLSAVLDYIYKGEIFLNSDNVLEVLDASVQFLLKNLQGHCAQFLLEKLRPQDAMATWYIARLYDLQELEEIAKAVTIHSFSRQLIFSKSNAPISSKFLTSVMNDSSLIANSTDKVELTLFWLSFDFENRVDDAENILKDFIAQNPLPLGYHPKSSELISHSDPDFKNWLNSQFSKILESQRSNLEESCSLPNPLSSSTWSLILQEDDCSSLAFYCPRNKSWVSCSFNCVDVTIIGLVSSNLLAVNANGSQISLVDLESGSRKPITNILRKLPRHHSDNKHTFDFFCNDGSLYALVTAFTESVHKPYFKVFCYNTRVDAWQFCMDIHYEYWGDEMFPGDRASVSLKVHTRQGSDNYLMVTITTKRKFETQKTPTKCIEGQECRFQEIKVFHVISFNPKQKKYETCGIRWQDPVELDQYPVFILSDKICFLKLDQYVLADKLRMSFVKLEECYMDAVCLVLVGRFWEKVTIGVPSPDLPVLPMTAYYESFYKLSVTSFSNKLFVGIQRSPHVFQVAVYDIEHFSALILPPSTLPAVSTTTMAVVALEGDIHWSDDTSKTLDTTSYCFTEFLLKKM